MVREKEVFCIWSLKIAKKAEERVVGMSDYLCWFVFGIVIAAFFEMFGWVLGVVREFGGLTELVGVLRGGSFWKGILSSFWT